MTGSGHLAIDGRQAEAVNAFAEGKPWLLRFFDRMVAEKFMRETIQVKYAVARSVAEIFPLVEAWKHQPGDAKWYHTR